MSFDNFKKCIDKVPRDVVICFSGFAEPWGNPECTKMLLYAYKKGFKVDVFTTAGGMDVSDVDLIKNIRFSRAFAVHLPDNKGYLKIVVDKKYLEVIDKLIRSKIKRFGFEYIVLNPAQDDIHPQVRSIFENAQVPVDKFKKSPLPRAGNIQIDEVPAREKVTDAIEPCPRFYRNILLPNGDVALCCCDWGLKHILGNLLVSGYNELFKSSEFMRLLKGLEDSSSDILCRYCERVNKKSRKRKPIKEIQNFIKRAFSNR